MNTDEMKKLADAGYTNLKFLDANARSFSATKPSYNYVFFDDMVMPKDQLVDKTKDGGLIQYGFRCV